MNQYHECRFEDLDYTKVARGIIYCTSCLRTWTLHPIWPKGASWHCNMPNTRRASEVPLWPLEPPEVLEARRVALEGSRAARIEMLARAERQRADEVSESLRTFERRHRGGKGPRGFKYDPAKAAVPDQAPHGDESLGAIPAGRRGSGSVFTKVSVFNSLRAQTERLRRDLTKESRRVR